MGELAALVGSSDGASLVSAFAAGVVVGTVWRALLLLVGNGRS